MKPSTSADGSGESGDSDPDDGAFSMKRKGRPLRLRDYARWTAGLAASAVLMYMAVLSVQEGVTLRTEVILGLLALIVILLYGVDSLVDLIQAWRDGGG